MNIVFQINDSPKETITKVIVNKATYQGTLRNETSVTDPIILIEGDVSIISTYNYMYIPKFHRYYYITDIRSIRSDLVEVSGHVDVLMSYDSEIRANRGIIKRQTYKYNTYLNDGSFRVYQNPMVLTRPFATETFNGFNDQEWVLGVAGAMRDLPNS